MAQLKQCIRSRFHCRLQPIEGELEIIRNLFQRSDGREAFDDIWKVKDGEVSLFDYNLHLIPWHCGLFLVRFVYRGGDRKLRIIQ